MIRDRTPGGAPGRPTNAAFDGDPPLLNYAPADRRKMFVIRLETDNMSLSTNGVALLYWTAITVRPSSRRRASLEGVEFLRRLVGVGLPITPTCPFRLVLGIQKFCAGRDRAIAAPRLLRPRPVHGRGHGLNDAAPSAGGFLLWS